MPHSHTETLYYFDELSDKAKEKARQWYREASSDDLFFAESVIEDAVRMGAMLGIEIGSHPVKLMNGSTRQDPTVFWSLGYSQGDFACFEGSYKFAPNARRNIAKETNSTEKTLMALATRLSNLQKEHRNALTATVKYHHYSGMEMTVDATTTQGHILEITPESEKELKDIFRAFNNWIYNQLRKENDYQNSDEQVDETIRVNEYDFHENGERA